LRVEKYLTVGHVRFLLTPARKARKKPQHSSGSPPGLNIGKRAIPGNAVGYTVRIVWKLPERVN